MKRIIHLGIACVAWSILHPVGISNAAEEEFGGGTSRSQLFSQIKKEVIQELGLGVAALSASMLKPFTFPSDLRNNAVYGIDISHYTISNIDWDRVAKQNVSFVYMKTSESNRFPDDKFQLFWNGLATHPKLIRGAYHFFSADDDAGEQAEYFLQKMGSLLPTDLPPAVDLEPDKFKRSSRKWQPKDDDDYWSNLTPEQITEKVQKFLDLVEAKTQRTPVIYTLKSWWDKNIVDDGTRFRRYPVWIASWKPGDPKGETAPTISKGLNWKFWQFSNEGDLTTGGIPFPKGEDVESLDVSLFNGTLQELLKALNMPLTDPAQVTVNAPVTPVNPSSDTVGTNKDPIKDASGATPPSGSGTPSGSGSGSGGVLPTDPAKDANLTPSGGNTPNSAGASSGGAMPTVTTTPSGPVAGPGATGGASAPKPDPTKDANLSAPNSNNPPASANPASSSTNTPKSGPAKQTGNDGFLGAATGNSKPPKANRNQNIFGLGGNPDIRME
jgi:lysozyme